MSHPAHALAEPIGEVSPAVQDYLKTCHRLSQQAPSALSTSRLAEAMNVSPPSVTNMIKRMEGLKLVKRGSAGKITLTHHGQAVALEVIRHHRLLETFLVNELGMEWAEAHKEAEVLEHYISERLEALLDQRMARPVSDPHGEPIPRRDGSLPQRAYATLLEQPLGSRLEIAQVTSQDPTLLKYLQDHQLTPGRRVVLKEIAPFNGPVALAIGRKVSHISREVAACIQVK